MGKFENFFEKIIKKEKQILPEKKDRISENPLADLQSRIFSKKLRGESLSEEEQAEFNALKRFGMQGNVKGFELFKKQQLENLSLDEKAELDAIYRFEGNKRLIELEKKRMLSTLDNDENEEYNLRSGIYLEIATEGKPWRENPELFEKQQKRLKELEQINKTKKFTEPQTLEMIKKEGIYELDKKDESNFKESNNEK